MIDICYIIGQLGKGGAERQLYELLKGLDRNRFAPVVITLSEGGYWKGRIQGLGIRVFELKRRKNMEFRRLFRLIRLLLKIRPAIVHTFLESANSYGRLAAAVTGRPVIIASERNAGELGRDKQRFQLFVDRFLSRFSDRIICNSRHCARMLVEEHSFKKGKVCAIHNGIDSVNISNGSPPGNAGGSTEKVVGIVGSLSSQKNHILFMDMAKIISGKMPTRKVRFMIVGGGPLEDMLKDHARKSEIEDLVTFTGERDDIPDILGRMDVFVITSHYEGLSNAIMEAMSAGLPVVATDAGGNRELVDHGVTGFLCPSGDALSLALNVIHLLDDHHMAVLMGKKGRARIIEEFGMKKMIDSTGAVYEEILKQKGRGAAGHSTTA
jgi:glycosyltransferase involved in cell wall biosynthesis